jgi:peptide/nickel transport system permease protein
MTWRSHPAASFIARRLATGIVLVWITSLLVFAAASLLPGDAATVILGKYATPENLAIVRERMGLDEPWLDRYLSWLGGVVQGDFGVSLTEDVPVWDLLSWRIVNTAILAGIATLLMLPIVIVLGVVSGRNPGRKADNSISVASLTCIGIPDFVIALFLALTIGVGLKLVPPVSLIPAGESPLTHPELLVLPVLTMLLAVLAYSVRMLRAGVVDVMTSDYVRMARLNGISESRVMLKHALPNALAPSIQVVALTILYFAGGVVTVEWIFNYPGVGSALVQAASARDIPTVQAIVLLVAVLYVVVTTIADLLVVMVVPRLRTSL